MFVYLVKLINMKKKTTEQRLEAIEATLKQNIDVSNYYIDKYWRLIDESSSPKAILSVPKEEEPKDKNHFFHPFIAALLIVNLIVLITIMNKLF